MTDIVFSSMTASARADRHAPPVASAMTSRVLILAIIAVASVAGFLVTDTADTAHIGAADPDLTRLLRAMTGLKLLMAAAATSAVLWRLAAPVSLIWLGAYATACAAMFAGPGLIWDMVHLKLGALLLHAGLIATLVLVWRDPVVARRLEAVISMRRSRA
jgi:hypothetical protein